MEKKVYKTLEYYFHGKTPRILLLSGMHGDEYQSGKLLEKFLLKNHADFPDFLYIPKVSPSAVASKKRKNIYGNDINRQFFPLTKDVEAQAVMSLLREFTFDICIDFHEDPDRALGFYMYDSEIMNEEELFAFRESIRQTKARLYSGIDDVDDKDLKLTVDQGYVSLGFEKTEPISGFLSRLLYEENKGTRSYTAEIPGKGTLSLKKSLIQKVLSFFVLKHSTVRSFFSKVYDLVKRVPPGKVTTYGALAKALGTRDARRVGQALHANPDENTTPCHRVVFTDGRLAPGYAFGGPNEQLRKLQLEGVKFLPDGRVDLPSSLYSPA